MSTVYARRSLRPLAPEVQAKIDKIVAIKASREGLRKVREAVARIQAELERQLAQARRASVGAGEPDGYLLNEVKALRRALAEIKV